MIKKTSSGRYVVTSKKSGKPLSKQMTKEKAEKRLKEIEYFKHKEK